MNFQPDAGLRSIAMENPATSPIFGRFGIDDYYAAGAYP